MGLEELLFDSYYLWDLKSYHLILMRGTLRVILPRVTYVKYLVPREMDIFSRSRVRTNSSTPRYGYFDTYFGAHDVKSSYYKIKHIAKLPFINIAI